MYVTNTITLQIKEALFVWFFIMSCSSLRRSGIARVNKVSRSFTHTFIHKWNKPPAFTPQPQNVTALWLVLISRSTEGRRLSWFGEHGEIVRWFTRPQRSPPIPVLVAAVGNRTRKSNALTTRQSTCYGCVACSQVAYRGNICEFECSFRSRWRWIIKRETNSAYRTIAHTSFNI